MIIRRINSTRENRVMRVAACARVSTIKEEQEESFKTQLWHYRARTDLSGVRGDEPESHDASGSRTGQHRRHSERFSFRRERRRNPILHQFAKQTGYLRVHIGELLKASGLP